MTPSDFVRECDRRGIALSLLPSVSPGGLPRIHYRVRGKLAPVVLETIRTHKAAIVSVLSGVAAPERLPVPKTVTLPEPPPAPDPRPVDCDGFPAEIWAMGAEADAEINAAMPVYSPPGVAVHVADDGTVLYEHEDGWGYYPPRQGRTEHRGADRRPFGRGLRD